MELIANNGWPLTLMNDSGFRKIMNPIIDYIGGGEISLNVKNFYYDFQNYYLNIKFI